MDMQAAFMADIAANPDDDTPRLIYADWLDDHGESDRAQFIRIQCRLASMGRYDLERYDLEGEEEALLAKHGKKWLKPLGKITSRVEFARGFPDRIALPVPKFVEKGEEAFAAAPTLREYRLLQPEPGWKNLMKCETLSRVRSLDAGAHRLGMGRVQELARCRHLVNLRSLNLSSSAMRPSGMAALAASPYLANLRKIDLTGSHLGDAAVEGIADSTHWKSVTSLDLSRNELTAAGIARLAWWEGSARLEDLAITEFEGGDDEARAFASGDWASLRSLMLMLPGMTSAGLDALGGCRTLLGLRNLSVEAKDGASVTGLFRSPYLAGVEHLYFRGSTAGSLGVLATSPMLPSLRSLSLGGADDAELQAVLAAPAAAGLRELSLMAGATSLVGVIAATGSLTSLRKLSLHTASAAALRALGSASHVSGLVELDLSGGMELTEAVARALIAGPHLARLRRLLIGHYPLPDEGALQLLRDHYGDGVVTLS